MNNEPGTEADFVERVRRAHAAQCAALDDEVLTRLATARRLAVERVRRRPTFWQASDWRLPAGAVALVLAGVVAGWLGWNASRPAAAPFDSASNGDLAIVLSNDNLDMYANMDFYRWLQAQQQPAQPEADDNG
ncbi:MAG TPA: hypothetical protein VFM15_08955 [Gammaproteobacteria bacterium]|nr:hypothetical protein [Gammaproteobacteria bacterium]